MLALEGIKVLDFGRGAPAPFCTWVLGDLGAEVIRIEVPPGASRLQGRAAVPQSFVSKEEERRRSAHNVLGRNKKSIALNLRSEEGRKIFLVGLLGKWSVAYYLFLLQPRYLLV